MGKCCLVVHLSSLLLAAAGPLASAADAPQLPQVDVSVVEDLSDSRIGELIIEAALQSILSKYEGLHLPALPLINIDVGEQASLSLALFDLNLHGISDVNVIEFSHTGSEAKGHNQTLHMTLPKVLLTVGTYNSAGYIINLPLNGEGPMSLAFHNLDIIIDFSWDKYTFAYVGNCVADNSTKYDLDLPRMQLQFDNLNAGTDQGQLINIMLSSFGPDIIDYLELLLNTSLYQPLDDALVGLLDNIFSCPTAGNERHFDPSDVMVFIEDLFRSFLLSRV